uniref:Chaperone protein dnaJ 39 n=1 Tax=Caligus rogercresseyi TaxID=217165 RepID=C1BRF7_CALRO|nr:Chaperone protein dnaJ 39 [Caligus rogercresseyi]
MESTPDHDWYAILEVPRSATVASIKASYKKLAIKNHPDKNLNDPEAANRFALISQAHIILTDPKMKQIYDTRGNTSELKDNFVVNVGELGTLARFTFGFFNKCGIHVETEIPAKITCKAQQIAKNESGPDDSLPTIIQFGRRYIYSEESQKEHFFTLEVTQESLNSGIVVSCRSDTKDKFKAVFFDADGFVSMTEESRVNDKRSEANFFFLPHPTYGMDTSSSLTRKVDEPPLFSMLKDYRKNIHSISPGKHLLCLYNNNWYSNANVQLLVHTYSPLNGSNNLQKIESSLAEKKDEIDSIKSEYTELQEKVKALGAKIHDYTEETKQLLSERSEIYDSILNLPIDNEPIYVNRKSGFFNHFFKR